ncbi:hypothetical protein [Blastomonas sp.]|uniref:hypothetical protein n=1 Tax=Blastomonas sp. TaxID=1909299 RepID=UPI0035947BA0
MNSIAKHVPDNIKRVSRAIGYAAWLDNFDAWAGLPLILAARLTARQRGALAFMALKSLDYETACEVADAALCEPLEDSEAA